MLTYIPVPFLFYFIFRVRVRVKNRIRVRESFMVRVRLGLGFGFGIGNLIGGAAGALEPCHTHISMTSYAWIPAVARRLSIHDRTT